MTNMNISDKFFEAVEDYNRTATDGKKKETFRKMTDDERKGVFYNCLRRQFNFGNYNARHANPALRVDELDCTFRGDGMLKTVSIKSYNINYVDYNSDIPRINIRRELSNIAKRHTVIHPTKVLNEMAQIVNSIN